MHPIWRPLPRDLHLQLRERVLKNYWVGNEFGCSFRVTEWNHTLELTNQVVSGCRGKESCIFIKKIAIDLFTLY